MRFCGAGRHAAAAAIVLLMTGGPVLASQVITTNEGGGQANPSPGSSADTGWNPQVSCTAEEGYSIFDLLTCLAVGIDPTFPCESGPTIQTQPSTTIGSPNRAVVLNQNPSGFVCPPEQTERSDYRVSFLPAPLIGIEILRWEPFEGSLEASSLFLREDDPNIQWTTITVNRPSLVARIHEIEGSPAGGVVEVRLNGRTASVPTTDRTRASDVTEALVTEIRRSGFVVRFEDPFIVVLADAWALTGLTSVSLRSTDHGVTKSEIHLDPLSSVGGIDVDFH